MVEIPVGKIKGEMKQCHSVKAGGRARRSGRDDPSWVPRGREPRMHSGSAALDSQFGGVVYSRISGSF